MSFVMIATGATTGVSRVRNVSVRSLWLAGSASAALLLAAGVGLGCWIREANVPTARAEAPRQAGLSSPGAALPFALERLGALSGRLFKLESQASQLAERLGARTGAAAKDKDKDAAAKKPGSGGPLLPPRDGLDAALPGLVDIEARIAQLEQQIALAADASTEQHLALMRMPSRAPIEGVELTSHFGNRDDPFTGRRSFHAGLDFGAEAGTPIHAAAGGTVSYAGFRADYGWCVEINHGNGLTTRYAHASRLLVRPDTLVTPGEVIAMVGSTGRSTGAHLHYEVLRRGEPVDPRHYLAGL